MAFSTKLLAWYDLHGRHDLPWQEDMTPYRIWVSEIMLQQTQVQTVMAYYQKFMARFPSLAALASATQDEVLTYWAGLGYYARGRNLHKAAQMIVADFNGEFPGEFDKILSLPGIGRSTAGAIMSLAFKKRMPILDGNVKRVLCRFKAIESWSGEKKTEQILWQMAEELTPKDRFDDYTQAIMDLGATLCKRSKPMCTDCPVKSECMAFEENRVNQLPVSKPKKDKPTRHVKLLCVFSKQGDWALYQRPSKGIWGGLWSFPEFTENRDIEGFIQDIIERKIETNHFAKDLVKWPEFKHSFTHYHLMIEPWFLSCERQDLNRDSNELSWVDAKALETLGLPAPIQKIISKWRKICLEK